MTSWARAKTPRLIEIGSDSNDELQSASLEKDGMTVAVCRPSARSVRTFVEGRLVVDRKGAEAIRDGLTRALEGDAA